jgi:hypothetical protein
MSSQMIKLYTGTGTAVKQVSGCKPKLTLTISSSGTNTAMTEDCLVEAHRTPGGMVSVRFSDERSGIVNLRKLGVDQSRLRMETVRASPWGSAIEITDNAGHVIHIDSAIARAYIDPEFAAKLQRRISELG